VEEPAVKGAYYVNGMRAIVELCGQDVVDRAKVRVSPEARAMMTTPPAVSEWISLKTRVEIFSCILEDELAASPELVAAIGKAAYLGSFKSVYKTFIKMFSPDFVLARVRPMWNASMKSCGSIEEHARGPQWVELAYRQMPYMRPWYWHYTAGGITAIAELTRVKNPQVTIVSGGGAADSCTFRVGWT
jgi:hypothetical protein